MKLFLLFLLIFPAAGMAAKPASEEQRKYKHADPSVFARLSGIAPFRLKAHSLYESHDIYFDTPELRLLKEGYSLRLRRVRKNGDHEYAVQLKSEMQVAGAARIEVEQKNLSRQWIRGKNLEAWIDRYFEKKENGKAADEEEAVFTAWFRSRMPTALAPFQELRHLGYSEEIFSPVVIGKDKRRRAHVYYDKTEAKGILALLEDSQKDFDLPEFFRNPRFQWLFELSWDNAVFMPARAGAKRRESSLMELEVENKMRPRHLGTRVLDAFETKLTALGFAPHLTSKYVQAVSGLF